MGTSTTIYLLLVHYEIKLLYYASDKFKFLLKIKHDVFLKEHFKQYKLLYNHNLQVLNKTKTGQQTQWSCNSRILDTIKKDLFHIWLLTYAIPGKIWTSCLVFVHSFPSSQIIYFLLNLNGRFLGPALICYPGLSLE